MRQARAPLVGWGAFLLLAIAASLLGGGAQLGFAAVAIGVLGLPHGAGDLALVAPAGRKPFLIAYLGTIGAVLLVWIAEPVLALGALLVCSAVHFALDDEDQGPLGWARGMCLVAAPAVLHRDGIAALFAGLTHDAVAAGDLAALLWLAGVVGLAIVIGGIVQRRSSKMQDGATAAALVATVLLPPLVGLAVGFVMLHAWRQTRERQHALRCPTMRAYLLLVAPVLAGAAMVLIGIVATAGRTGGDVAILFAGIAALAMPHMLVTPFWHRRPARALTLRPRSRAAVRL